MDDFIGKLLSIFLLSPKVVAGTVIAIGASVEASEGISFSTSIQDPIPGWGSISRSRYLLMTDSESTVYYSNYDEDDDDRYDESRRCLIPKTRNVMKHLLDRFTCFLHFGGIIQRISQLTGIDRNDIVTIGADQFQYRSSGRGADIHAAYVIRAGEISTYLRLLHPYLYMELANYLGHTQEVPRLANLWYGVGGSIDRFQDDNTNTLYGIDFSGSLTPKISQTLRNLVQRYVRALSMGSRPEIHNDISEAINRIRSMSEELLFEYGTSGYSGELMRKYCKY